MEKHNKQWFLDRIGKKVFRTNGQCKCEVCANVVKNGLIIAGELHAIYLYDCQNELDLFYFDKK